jgi:LysM repeat protein
MLRRFVRVSIVWIFLCIVVLPAAASNGFKTIHKVRKSDTLSRIAKQYKVSIKQIRRWNRLRSSVIRPGKKLVIYTRKKQHRTHKLTYIVKRGEFKWEHVARKHRMSVKRLQRLNRRLHRRMRRAKRKFLRYGQKLTVERRGPSVRSREVGKPQGGRLENGEQLSSGYGYWVRNPKLAYGTNDAISELMRCLPTVKNRWKKTSDIMVGDLSRKTGGKLKKHRSHQTGRDVDVAYIHRGKQPRYFKTATRATLDVVKTWLIFKCFLNGKRTELIFVDYSLQPKLYNYVKRRGASKRQLKKLFQYPRGRKRPSGIIRHSPKHKDHFHVRFKKAST